MIFLARPNRRLNLRRLFASRSDELVRLIERPPVIRQSGFDLDSGGRSQIIGGRLRRCVEPGYSLVEIHRDGTVIYAVTATSNGLAWGSEKIQPFRLRVNPVALIEKIYLFCVLVANVMDDPLLANIFVDEAILFRNLEHENTHAVLKAGNIDSWGARSGTAPSAQGDLVEEELMPVNEPERAAYLLVARVYAWFGLDEDAIPYKINVTGRQIIDVEAIRSL